MIVTTRKSSPWGAVAGVAVAVAILIGLALFALAVFALTGEPLPDAAGLVRRGALTVWSLLVPWGLLIPALLIVMHYAPRIAGALDADKRELARALDNAAALCVTERRAREDAEREMARARGVARLVLAEYDAAGGPAQDEPDARGAVTWLRREAVAGRLAMELAEQRGGIIERTSAQLVRAVEERDEARAVARRAVAESAERDEALAAMRAELDAPVQPVGAGVQDFIAAATASRRRGIAPMATLYRRHVGSLNTNDPATRSLFSALIALLPSPDDASLVEAMTEGEGAAGAGEGTERARALNAERSALNAERDTEREGVEG